MANEKEAGSVDEYLVGTRKCKKRAVEVTFRRVCHGNMTKDKKLQGFLKLLIDLIM